MLCAMYTDHCHEVGHFMTGFAAQSVTNAARAAPETGGKEEPFVCPFPLASEVRVSFPAQMLYHMQNVSPNVHKCLKQHLLSGTTCRRSK